MLKRRNPDHGIDKYIRNATAGLPNRERIDTAAELRVHLNQKTRELMAQGFPREEAEHLAVQEMGPVASTNRALLGHVFTAKLGWAVLSIMVFFATTWAYREFWRDTTVSEVEPNLRDLEQVSQYWFNYRSPLQKFNFAVPHGAVSLEIAEIQPHSHSVRTIADSNANLNTDSSQSDLAAQHGSQVFSLLIASGNRQAEAQESWVALFDFDGPKTLLRSRGALGCDWLKVGKNDLLEGKVWINSRKFPNSRLGLNKWLIVWGAESFRTLEHPAKPPYAIRPTGSPIGGCVLAIRANSKPVTELERRKLRIAWDQKQRPDDPSSVWKIVETSLPGTQAAFGDYSHDAGYKP